MPEQPASKAESDEDQAASAPTGLWWRSRRGVAFLVVGVVVLQALAYAWYTSGSTSATGILSPEVALGEYQYRSGPAEESPIQKAEFQLHIALLKELQTAGRGLIEQHRLRVEQNVEELLRRAHGGDFEDPSLTELKRQIQETINKTVGHRVIAEVIITKLKLQRLDEPVSLSPTPREAENPAQASSAFNVPAKVGHPGDTAWLRGNPDS